MDYDLELLYSIRFSELVYYPDENEALKTDDNIPMSCLPFHTIPKTCKFAIFHQSGTFGNVCQNLQQKKNSSTYRIMEDPLRWPLQPE
jgi:hypothetical protein